MYIRPIIIFSLVYNVPKFLELHVGCANVVTNRKAGSENLDISKLEDSHSNLTKCEDSKPAFLSRT